MRASECCSWSALRCAAAGRGACVGGPTCLEWPRESGCLKKESGSFLILMGRDDGCRLALLGFITALKRASSSVCESPRTCTICCPAGGAPWCASMSPKFGVAAKKKLNSTQNGTNKAQKSGRVRRGRCSAALLIGFVYNFCPHQHPHPPTPAAPPLNFCVLACLFRAVTSRGFNRLRKETRSPGMKGEEELFKPGFAVRNERKRCRSSMPPTYLQADRPFPPFSLSLSVCLWSCRGNKKLKKSQPGKKKKKTLAARPTPSSAANSGDKINDVSSKKKKQNNKYT